MVPFFQAYKLTFIGVLTTCYCKYLLRKATMIRAFLPQNKNAFVLIFFLKIANDNPQHAVECTLN
jgi:hypothetical protein